MGLGRLEQPCASGREQHAAGGRRRERRKGQAERRREAQHASPPKGGLFALFLAMAELYPSLCVFDLDWTLWPLDVDTDRSPPFTATAGVVRDKHGTPCELYPEVRSVFARLQAAGVRIAYASRTTDPGAAEALLKAHGLWEALRGDRGLFQAYPSGGALGGDRAAKTRHFAAIFEALGGEGSPRQTLFFDDLQVNIEVARRSGVTGVQVGRGVTLGSLEAGLAAWRLAQKQ